MYDAQLNNNGILGSNTIVTLDHLTTNDRNNLDGFILDAVKLKERLASERAQPSSTGRKARSGKESPNTYIDIFRRISSYENMPSRLEDIFIGATRQNTTNSQHNAYTIFGLMKSLPVITTEAVYVRLNQRRSTEDRFGQRYAQQLASACRNVIKVFDHHEHLVTAAIKQIEDMESVVDSAFDIKADAEGYTSLTHAPLSKGELTRNLKLAGLNDAEIERLHNGQRIGCSNHLRVRAGFSFALFSPHYNEVYKGDSLEWIPELRSYVDTGTGEVMEWL